MSEELETYDVKNDENDSSTVEQNFSHVIDFSKVKTVEELTSVLLVTLVALGAQEPVTVSVSDDVLEKHPELKNVVVKL